MCHKKIKVFISSRWFISYYMYTVLYQDWRFILHVYSTFSRLTIHTTCIQYFTKTDDSYNMYTVLYQDWRFIPHVYSTLPRPTIHTTCIQYFTKTDDSYYMYTVLYQVWWFISCHVYTVLYQDWRVILFTTWVIEYVYILFPFEVMQS